MKKNIPGLGHGIEGRFAGLDEPYSLESFAKVVILPVPFDMTTTYRKGTDKGPAALIEASRNLELYDIETNCESYLNGIFTADPIIANSSKEMIENTYQRTKQYLEQGKFIVTIGGEHSISYAPIKAHAEKYDRITVLQFDAHADLQPAYEGDPWSHASAMARVMEIPQVHKIVSVGIRSMAIEEKPYVERENMFYAHDLYENDDWMAKATAQLEGPVYITFDLDVFDSSLMPSTGTPEPGGLFWWQVFKFLKKVIQTRRVIGLDVVELCPTPTNHAPDFLAAKLIYKFLCYLNTYSKERS